MYAFPQIGQNKICEVLFLKSGAIRLVSVAFAAAL